MLIEKYQAWCIQNNDTDVAKFYEDLFKTVVDRQNRIEALAERDLLHEAGTKVKTGAFFTPLVLVDKMYEYLDATLGVEWQKEYVVWDMCCGTGNLLSKHQNPRKVFISTLEQSDVDILKASGAYPNVWQYDYLNDDISSSGQIDYSITDKIPASLRKAIKHGQKKLLILINPPYLNSGTTETKGAVNTKCKDIWMKGKYGQASNELTVQFLVRIAKEFPAAIVGIVSPLKYIQGASCEKFKEKVWNYQLEKGFMFRSKHFGRSLGDFPVGFAIWKASKKIGATLSFDVLDDSLSVSGAKAVHICKATQYLNKWISRPKTNKNFAIPLKNAVSPAYSFYCSSSWSDNAIGYFYCNGNDMACSSTGTCLLSSIYSNPNGMYVNAKNLLQVAMVYAVRRTKQYSWLVKGDPFYQPYNTPNDDFALDCLMFMLFDGMNLSASTIGLEWDGKTYDLVNHFIPFTEAQVGCSATFRSNFMSNFLAELFKTVQLSTEAQAVYNEGLKIWQQYFKQGYTTDTIKQYQLYTPDVGWYQIRGALNAKLSCFEALKVKIQQQAIIEGFVR